MILYVNGDSHSAGAEAVNSYAFAEDDPLYYGLGRQPHPDNIQASYGCDIANRLYAILHTDAESASSNDRILRTTRAYLKEHTPDLIIIGWSSWEREEWLHDGIYWQVNAGGVGHDWPDSIKERYHNWILSIDYKQKEQEQHDKIWTLHNELKDIPHLFFNCFSNFNCTEQDWGNNYIKPYDINYTYHHWLAQHGFKTVNPTSYHYGADAHRAWADFLTNHLTNTLNGSTITK